MNIDIKVPLFPESINDGEIISWNKSLGSFIKEGEIIVEIETDKILIEIPSPSNGIMKKQFVKEGDTVFSEQSIGEIEKINGKNLKNEKNLKKENKKYEVKEEKKEEKTINKEIKEHINLYSTPSIRRMLSQKKLDIKNIQDYEKINHLLKDNIVNHTPNNKEKKLIDKENISRIEKRVKMTRLRKILSKRLLEVQHNNAILTTFNEVNMQEIIQLRYLYKDLFQEKYGVRLGFMSFFVKAVTESLKLFPEINASLDGEDIVYHGYFDISIAISSPRGLVVPVLRNTDSMSMSNIEKNIFILAEKAKNGSLSIEDLQGGNFTITNGGTFGSMLSTPIINPPQSAILGMHNIIKRPVVIDEKIVIRPMMYLALSYDHRIIDGEGSIKFLKTIKKYIESPIKILLKI